MSEITFQPLGKPIALEKELGEIADIDPRLTRTHYFDGRLLTAEDLTRDQIYLDQRLREVGQVLGSGILSGLVLSFDVYTGRLSLTKGMALSVAGRVLELNEPLEVNLGDRALIAGLNKGRHRRFNRALYAVVLRYVEVGTDVAEVFPKDLGDKRGFQYDLITESVQLGLVALPTPLPQQNQLHVRARLMRQLLDNDRIDSLIPEDAVALGVLAIQNDRPQWLDQELLRHPARNEMAVGELQADVSRMYENLFADVLNTRRGGGLTGDFAAKNYFSLLPPTGSLPKEAIDPVAGRQGYFPENYQVWVAPIRQSDVALIKKESMGLPPIDLSLKEPVDIVVLAPLANRQFGWFAGRLERNLSDNQRRLPQLDLLRLRLHPRRPVHKLDTDADTWQGIWEQIDENELFYLRRPTRAAETAISGIVLAQGTSLPAPPPMTPGPPDGGDLVEDEQAVLLRYLNFSHMTTHRPPTDDTGNLSATALTEEFGADADVVLASLRVLLRVERRYDQAVWPSLLELARNGGLPGFADELTLTVDDVTPTGQRVAAIGPGHGLSAGTIATWTTLDP